MQILSNPNDYLILQMTFANYSAFLPTSVLDFINATNDVDMLFTPLRKVLNYLLRLCVLPYHDYGPSTLGLYLSGHHRLCPPCRFATSAGYTSRSPVSDSTLGPGADELGP